MKELPLAGMCIGCTTLAMGIHSMDTHFHLASRHQVFPSSFPALFLGSHPATTPATSRNPLRRLTPAREEVAALPEKVAPCYPATCPRKSPERRSPCRASFFAFRSCICVACPGRSRNDVHFPFDCPCVSALLRQPAFLWFTPLTKC